MSTTTPCIRELTQDAASALLESSKPVILSSADGYATDAAANLGLVQQARLSQFTRAAATATAQYGAGSKQAVAARNSVTATQSAISRITLVNQQVTTPAPTVAATGWALHGRVYDSNLSPLPSYTVFLVDGDKSYLSTYGFAYTDNTGYFLLNYAGNAAGTAGAPTEGTDASAGGGAQPVNALPEYYLQIADTKANPVFLSTSAFLPSVGAATYQVVTLPAGEPALGDPPAEVRAVALPPVDKKA
jgi:hypothetical protein